MRIKAVVSYDGSFFQGFQKQKHTKNTVTTKVEEALKNINIDSSIVGSGRTDAGVHASGQIIHFDIPTYWSDTHKLTKELNRKLQHIYIKKITKVENDFHARFSAKRRLYRYIFKQKKPSIFEEQYISYYPSFQKNRISDALTLFQGKHDFKYFQKSGSVVHTTIRELYRASYKQWGEYHIIYFEANGFLRSQVRMMIDIVMLYANNQITIEQLQNQIDAKKRYSTTLAPPQGLYLARVIY